MAEYAIINTELVTGTDVRSQLRSVRYGTVSGTDFTPKEIQNGSVVTFTDEIEPDLYMAVDPKANTPLKDIVILATPEIMYDERKRNLNEFINEAGDNATGFIPNVNDIFSMTAEGFDGTPKVGNIVEVQAGTKMKTATAATANSTQIGKIIGTRVREGDTYYRVRVTG